MRGSAALILVLFLLFTALSMSPALATGGWVRTWGTNAYAAGYAVTFDSAGNVYVVGGVGSRVLLLKYALDGSLDWQKAWGGSVGDLGFGVATDSSGSVYITGAERSFNPWNNDQAFLLKVNSSGALAWQKAIGNGTRGGGVAVSPSGNVYVIMRDFTLLQFDPSGNLLWQKAWSTGSGHYGTGIAVEASGNVYLTGDVLLKLNSTGDLQWQRSWRMNNITETGTSIAIDSAGNIIVGSYRDESTENCMHIEATIAKLDGNGSLLWHRSWQDRVDPTCYSHVEISGVAADASGNIYATGADPSVNAFLMGLDLDGNLISMTALTGFGGSSRGDGIAVDQFDTPVVVGGVSISPSRLHSVNMNPTLDTRMALTTVPVGALRNTTYSQVNLTGTLYNVQGSTTYAGGGDVFLSYGHVISVPIFPSLQLILLASTLIILSEKFLLRGRFRARPPRLAAQQI